LPGPCAGRRRRVAEREVAGVIGRLLGGLGAADLAIEDPPLEEVLRAMFGEQRRAEAETAVEPQTETQTETQTEPKIEAS
jgi:hypothetical protein